MQPAISVIIPVHNAESTIAAALSSILRQTRTDFELLVVDDGSTDHTPDIVDSIAARDPRILVIQDAHRGIIPALNLGLSAAGSPLVARMDADDISHPHRLELQAQLMQAHPEISVCSCRIKMFPRRGLLGGMVRYEQWLNSLLTHDAMTRDIFIESPIAHPSVMLRREELIQLGGYQDHGWAEDYDLWLRYHIAGRLFAKLPQTLVYWRQSEGRLTFTDPRYSVENFLRAKAHYLAKLLGECDRPIFIWGAGKTGRRLSKHMIREGLPFEAAIDIAPDKIGRKLRGRPIYPHSYLAERPDAFVIAAVSSLGSRALIREYLTSLGRVETRDFICAA